MKHGHASLWRKHHRDLGAKPKDIKSFLRETFDARISRKTIVAAASDTRAEAISASKSFGRL